MVVPQSPTQNFAFFLFGFAVEFARFFGQIPLDHTGLGQFDIAVDHNRGFTQLIDLAAIGLASGFARKEIYFNRVPI